MLFVYHWQFHHDEHICFWFCAWWCYWNVFVKQALRHSLSFSIVFLASFQCISFAYSSSYKYIWINKLMLNTYLMQRCFKVSIFNIKLFKKVRQMRSSALWVIITLCLRRMLNSPEPGTVSFITQNETILVRIPSLKDSSSSLQIVHLPSWDKYIAQNYDICPQKNIEKSLCTNSFI